MSPEESDTAQRTVDLSQRLPRLISRPRKQSAASAQTISAPETPCLPPPISANAPLDFIKPCRRILSVQDHRLFLSSPTYQLLLAFIFGISDSVRGTKRSSLMVDKDQDDNINVILDILDECSSLITSFPPLETGSRFGNPVFQTYVEAVGNHLGDWHSRLSIPTAAIDEISTYLENSFGSASRIDYGSGHELNFFLWLLCLNRVGLLSPASFPTLALVVFPRYLALMRTLQTTYYLEPAGSHGVWGLDDYQFLPFLFGASQLLHHPFITPKSIHSRPTLDQFAGEYLYLDQVAFINSVKNVEGLRWHSPMLDDISAARSWEKIEAGMKKMFINEVLGKLPVMQHFLFGSIIPAVQGMSADDSDDDGGSCRHGHGADKAGSDCKHEHNHKGSNGWSDCCGIQVPSSMGAAQEMKKNMQGQNLRRLPFD